MPEASSTPLLEIRGLAKSFPGVRALDGVDLTVGFGEIHALLGENGAGKSTLIKVLTGVHTADAGEFKLAGMHVRATSPREAEALGISTVYQEVNLIPSLSIAENITLGRQSKRFGLLDWTRMRKRARTALARLEISCDVDAELGSISVALQQMVAIARALDQESKLLILDEPTASLDQKEVDELFKVMRRLKSQNLGIIFVTHFLDQVYAVTDRITVLRNGQRVGEYNTLGLPKLELVGKMLGRAVSAPEANAEKSQTATSPIGKAIVRAQGVYKKGSVGPIDFSAHCGEVLGLAGLLGSGRTETVRLLFGIDRLDSGSVCVDEKTTHAPDPREMIGQGMAFCSEDRKTEGILPNLSVRENLIVALQGQRGSMKPLSRSAQEKLCEHYIRALKIKTASTETAIRNLSGGNQQKVLLARWLATQPKIIILDEPTRGIDIGAKEEIEQLIAALAKDGVSVILISSEIEEIVRNCSRAIVLRERKKAAEISGTELSGNRLMEVMAG